MVQGLALLESSQGNYGAAQQVFQQGADNCPPHAPLFNAWAAVEVLFLTASLIELLAGTSAVSVCVAANQTALLWHDVLSKLDGA